MKVKRPRRPALAGGRRERLERGAVAVEFALVVPLLVMLVFAVISFGMVLAQKASLSSAVRSGARYGSVNLYADVTDPTSSHTCQRVIEQARDAAESLGMQGSDISVKVLRGKAEATAVAVCQSDAGAGAGVTGSASQPPCTSTAVNPENLYVRATFPASISVPVAGINTTFDLQSTGAYRCEYR